MQAHRSRGHARRLRRERRILTFEETARVLLRFEEPYRLIIETCIATGARISEVLALEWKHLGLKTGTIKIEQRVWDQEISRLKSEGSKRTLGIGDLITRFHELGKQVAANKEELIFQQKRAPGMPLWDSGVRDALHQAAQAENCDFEGFSKPIYVSHSPTATRRTPPSPPSSGLGA